MHVLPVLDVRGGEAVRADGGPRGAYRPLRSVLGPAARPAALARALREELGLGRIYVAHLDALESWRPEAAVELVRELASAGGGTWVDAGAGEPGDVERLLGAGAERVVVALETLPSLASLGELARAAEPHRLAFSLDLRDGRPVAPRLATRLDPEAVAVHALEAGFETILVLELGRVGRRTGPAAELFAGLRRGGGAKARWYAAGGVRGVDDLRVLAAAGWDGCLVGTAIHDGTLGRAEMEDPHAPARQGEARLRA